MTNGTPTRSGVDKPSNVATARWLAKHGASLAGLDNYEKSCLLEIGAALDAEPPRVTDALATAQEGVAHAWRGSFVEDRAEAWICAAVVALLRAESKAGVA